MNALRSILGLFFGSPCKVKLNGATAGRPIVRAHSDFYFQPDRDWKRREGLRWGEMDIGTSGREIGD